MEGSNHDHVLYDDENDVLYVILSDHDVACTKALDDLRLVDYDASDEPVGIEFISASDGLDLAGTPLASRIQALLDEAGIPFPIHA